VNTAPDGTKFPSINDLKLMAYREKELPAGLGSAEQIFYIKARALYKAKLPEAQGKREMAEIERAYLSDSGAERINYKISQLWKRIEPHAVEYAKSPSVDSADRFYAAVYGLSNNWRVKRN
jgi:hypothetical protein